MISGRWWLRLLFLLFDSIHVCWNMLIILALFALLDRWRGQLHRFSLRPSLPCRGSRSQCALNLIYYWWTCPRLFPRSWKPIRFAKHVSWRSRNLSDFTMADKSSESLFRFTCTLTVSARDWYVPTALRYRLMHWSCTHRWIHSMYVHPRTKTVERFTPFANMTPNTCNKLSIIATRTLIAPNPHHTHTYYLEVFISAWTYIYTDYTLEWHT
jgi:hypothetical protein